MYSLYKTPPKQRIINPNWNGQNVFSGNTHALLLFIFYPDCLELVKPGIKNIGVFGWLFVVLFWVGLFIFKY